MKKFLFVCNFKMNSIEVEKYNNAMNGDDYSNVVLCPNFVDIKDFAELKKSNNIGLGAQNVSAFDEGARTGEISAKMLKKAGVEYCIVGHSERKKYNFETLDEINQKAKVLQQNGIKPIICVGEDILKDNEFAKKYVLFELNTLLKDLDFDNLIVAYEPIWSIGTGDVPTDEYIDEILSTIKKYTPVKTTLYGGSFGESNYKEIGQIESVDGALIGGASKKPELICKMRNDLNDILKSKC
ncbi:MAG: triosephosphate isomerase [Clostridia bacterium]|nr:triosephosphate isomerase [Clostridia bacterium]